MYCTRPATLLAILGVFASATALGAAEADVEQVVSLLDLVIDTDEETARRCLKLVTNSVQDGSLDGERTQALRNDLSARLAPIVADAAHPLQFDALQLTAALGDADSVTQVARWYSDAQRPAEQRLAALQTLIAAGASRTVLDAVSDTINEPQAG